MLRAVPRGLETGLQGSLHTEAAELLGLHNVAQIADRHGLTQVSMEISCAGSRILFWFRRPLLQIFIRRDPLAGRESGCGTTHLILSGLPFGWLDARRGINRLLGLRRTSRPGWIPPSIASLK